MVDDGSGAATITTLVPILGGRLPTFAPFFVPLFFETRQPFNRQEEDGSPAPSPLTLTTMTPTLLLEKDDDGTTATASTMSINETAKIAVESEDTRESSIVTANANAQLRSSSPSLNHSSSLRHALSVCASVAVIVSCV